MAQACGAQTTFTVYNADIEPIEIWIKGSTTKSWENGYHVTINPKRTKSVSLTENVPYDLFLRKRNKAGTELFDLRGDRLRLYEIPRGLPDGTGIKSLSLREAGHLQWNGGRWVRIPILTGADRDPLEIDLAFDAVEGRLYLDFPQWCKKLEDPNPPPPIPPAPGPPKEGK